jgi:hypothetical protein
MAKVDLFDWASKRPVWQQDTLRRICEQGCLYENDLDEVQSQIEAANGLVPAPTVESRPIEKAHLVDRSESAPKTILGSIGPLKNVDRLATGQNPLRFAVDGITLIYGANGSGKSGYCRIAKKICRCLHEITLSNCSPGVAARLIVGQAPRCHNMLT